MFQRKSYTTSIKLFQIIYNIIEIFQNILCHIFEKQNTMKTMSFKNPTL